MFLKGFLMDLGRIPSGPGGCRASEGGEPLLPPPGPHACIVRKERRAAEVPSLQKCSALPITCNNHNARVSEMCFKIPFQTASNKCLKEALLVDKLSFLGERYRSPRVSAIVRSGATPVNFLGSRYGGIVPQNVVHKVYLCFVLHINWISLLNQATIF